MKMSAIYDGLLNGSLVPRYHSGVGMIQMYLNEQYRIHVWHPELRAKTEAFGNRHSHRFDLTSTVLLGNVFDTALRLEPNFFNGRFETFDVVPAHKGVITRPTPNDAMFDLIVTGIRHYRTGETYAIKKFDYHETKTEGLTVTLLRKDNQEETHARIIGFAGQRPIHAMANPPEQTLLNQLMFSALRKLSPEAVQTIEQQTE
jgi:hypothetical protein